MSPEEIAFQLDRFELVEATDQAALLRVAGRWRADLERAVPALSLVVERGDVWRRLDPLPGAEPSPVVAAPPGAPWRAAFAAPAELADGARFRLEAGAEAAWTLPPPDSRVVPAPPPPAPRPRTTDATAAPQRFEAEVSRAWSRADELIAEVSRLRAEAATGDRERRDLRRRLEDAERDRGREAAERERLAGALASERAGWSEALEAARELREDAGLTELGPEAEPMRAELQARILAEQRARADQVRDVEAMALRVRELESALADSNRAAVNAAAERDDAIPRLARSTARAQELEEAAREAEGAARAARERVETAAQAQASLERRVADLERRLESVAGEARGLAQRADEVVRQADGLADEAAAAGSQAEIAQERIDALGTASTNAERALAAARAQRDRASRSRQQAQDRVVELEDILGRAESARELLELDAQERVRELEDRLGAEEARRAISEAKARESDR